MLDAAKLVICNQDCNFAKLINQKIDNIIKIVQKAISKATKQDKSNNNFEQQVNWAKQAVGLVNDPEIKKILNNIITIVEEAV